MPINPNIPLSLKADRTGQIISGGIQDILQDRERKKQQGIQNEQQNRLLSLREDQAEQERGQLEQQGVARSIGTLYQNDLAPLYKSGNFEQVGEILNQRLGEIGTQNPEGVALSAALDRHNRDPQGAMSKFQQVTRQAQFEKLIPPDNASSSRGSFFTPKDVTINGETVPFTFNNRTGEWERANIPGATSPQHDPVVQRNVAEGKASGTEKGKATAKRKFNMSGVMGQLDLAENLLTGKETGQKPTGSGVGSVVDAAAGLVGSTPSGAEEASRLDVIGGSLIGKVPRFEGPQSDKDVNLYKQMAGRLGDRSQPIKSRLSALKTLREVMGKYDENFKAKQAPQKAIEMLKNNSTPEMKKFFKDKFGFLPEGM